jgi:predicted DNA-binding protein with PD1-like motif
LFTFEVRDDELVASLNRQIAEAGISDGAIVSLIGAAEDFTISTMPADDALKDDITTYNLPAEMTGTGEIRSGFVHIHVVMGVAGDRAVAGHLHAATIRTHFARAYVLPSAS